MPPELHAMLAGKADAAGVLPGWTDWWEPSDVAEVFPDDVTRRRVEREQPRLPLSYFAQTLPVPAGWTDLPTAYLAFGDTYAAEREVARGRGWPVKTMAARHLHMLAAPDDVATQLDALLGAILKRSCAPASARANDR